MRANFFFLLLFFSCTLAAQPYKGRYVEKHPGGKIAVKGRYSDGKKSGEWKYYDEKQHLRKTETYVNGLLEGWQRTYHENGKVASETFYAQGLREAEHRQKDNEGRLLVEGKYAKDKKQGSWQYYFEGAPGQRALIMEGQVRRTVPAPLRLRKEETYLDGRLHGMYVEYDKNNVKLVEGVYEKGLRQGEFREWGKDYQYRYERWYSNDSLVREIELTSWGLKRKETSLRAGIRHGTYREWYPDGRTLKLEGNYREGKRDGLFSEWRKTGAKWIEYTYADERLNGVKREYDAQGVLKLVCYLADGQFQGAYTTYHSNGSPLEKWNCVNGNFEGPYERRYVSGEVAETGNYVNDLREGIFTAYFPDGKIKFTANYKQGFLDGLFQELHPNGKKHIEQQFRRDTAAGALSVWDENGKKLRMREPSVQIPPVEIRAHAGPWSGGGAEFSPEEPLDALRRQASWYVEAEAQAAARKGDEPAEFPNGVEALTIFLQNNMHYPVMEREAGIMGTLYMQVTIGASGKISDVSAVREIAGGAGFTKEAVRVLKFMPDWKPARRRGRAMSSTIIVPLRFSLY